MSPVPSREGRGPRRCRERSVSRGRATRRAGHPRLSRPEWNHKCHPEDAARARMTQGVGGHFSGVSSRLGRPDTTESPKLCYLPKAD